MKILVCVDGSPQSYKAAEKAAEIAAGCNVNHIAIITVVEKSYYPIMEQGTRIEIEDEIEKHQQLLDKLMKKRNLVLEQAAGIFRRKGLEVEKLLMEGHAADTISEVAEKQRFDMIVVGSRGRGGLKKLLLGSVSNALIQQTKVNVLVIKEGS